MPTNLPKLNDERVFLPSGLTRAINNRPVLLCIITLLLLAIAILRFPGLGAIVAEYHQL